MMSEDEVSRVYVVLLNGQVHEIHGDPEGAKDAATEYRRASQRRGTGNVYEVMPMASDSAEEARRTRRRIR